jgi:hypothetical protein
MEQKIISVGTLVERRDASLNAENGSASHDTGTPTKPSLSLSLRESIERRVKNSLVYDTTVYSYGHNHVRDARLKNFLDLAHEGPFPIAETLLHNEEEIKDCRKPAK